MEAQESREIGGFYPANGVVVGADGVGFWLPLLARTVAQVTGVTDYNIVQNNGTFVFYFCANYVHGQLLTRSQEREQRKSYPMYIFT